MSTDINPISAILKSIGSLICLVSVLVIVIRHNYLTYLDLWTKFERLSVWHRRSPPKITQSYKINSVLICLSGNLYVLSVINLSLMFNASYKISCNYFAVPFLMLFQMAKLTTYASFLFRTHIVWVMPSYGPSKRFLKLLFGVLVTATILIQIFAPTKYKYFYFQDSFPYSCEFVAPSYALGWIIWFAIATSFLCINPLRLCILHAKSESQLEHKPLAKRIYDGYKVAILISTSTISTIICYIIYIILNKSVIIGLDCVINTVVVCLLTAYYPDNKYYNRLCYPCIWYCDPIENIYIYYGKQKTDTHDINTAENTNITITTDHTTKNTVTIASALPSKNEGAQYLSTGQQRLNVDLPVTVGSFDSFINLQNRSIIIPVEDKPNESDNCKTSNCNDVIQLKLLMNEYNFTTKLNDYTTIEKSLNNFLHLLHKHNSNHEFEKITNQLQQCNINKCNIFRRNCRDQVKFKDDCKINDLYNEKIDATIAYLQILDKIHCFYQHSVDIGNRLSMQEIKCLNIKDNIEGYGRNQNLIRLNQLLLAKRKNVANIHQQSDRMNVKYNQLKVTDNAEKYFFGCEFRYDGTGEENETEYNALIVSNKYSNLKEELTTNTLNAHLTIKQFNIEYIKAQKHFDSDYRKKTFQQICIENILSLMIYCNFDELQREFSQTYWERCGYTHCNFYHLGKYLKQAVHSFGTRMIDGEVKRFYHGIGKQLVFPQIIGKNGIGVQIYCPLSTTSSMAVAANFTNNNDGLIVEFGSDCSKAKYFAVCWLSDYGNESEYLFIQNEFELGIRNIMDCNFGIEFGMLIKALNILDQIVSEQYLEEKISKQLKYLMIKIIHHQLSMEKIKYKTFSSLHDYGKNLIHVYCTKKK
eukprot:247289_1